MDNLSPSSPEDYLRKALSTERLLDPETLPSIVFHCERSPPSDAAELLQNTIQGNGKHVIAEYLHRRSLGSVYNSKDDSLDNPMQIYRKPEVSLTSSSTGKNKKKVIQSKQATQSIKATNRTHEQVGVGRRLRDNGKEHRQEREGTSSVPIQNLRRGEPCDCQARRHNLVNNCLGCGKIICEQEGEGPCNFCGSEVWHSDRHVKHLIGPSEQISESEEKANVLKNKLLEYDRNEKSQTTIIDDQSDYFNIEGNSWLSPEEKKELQREELEKAENISQRRTVLFLDPAGGKVSIATEDDIQQTDVSSRVANKEKFQNFHVEPSPNIKTRPAYVDVGISSQRNHSRSKRIPDSMKVSSGRVQQEFRNLQSSTGRAILDQVVFDICMPKDETVTGGGKPVKLSSSLYVQTQENNRITEYHEGKSEIQVLKSGLILLKNWLSQNDQVNIVKNCRRLGIGEGGFYQPSFGGRRKMHLWMMCLGKDWDPESRLYGEIRYHDNTVPPRIPTEFVPLVYRAIHAAHDALRKNGKLKGADVEHVLPYMDPDVCIVNFYNETGRLGLHQDKDESSRSLYKGLPVVSFSIGDSAEFLYGTERDIDKAEGITLESGDVLIFGGESRLIFHGISHVNPHTSPKWLIEDTGLRLGRLNLTFRQI